MKVDKISRIRIRRADYCLTIGYQALNSWDTLIQNNYIEKNYNCVVVCSFHNCDLDVIVFIESFLMCISNFTA
jgi:hypothetical protein